MAACDQNILTAYVLGQAAADLARLDSDQIAGWVRREAILAFPEAKTSFDLAEINSYSWDSDQLNRGGYPWPEPGHDRLPKIFATAEACIHLAGEQTTHHFGWIQGALESGLRAAREVHEA